MKNTMIVIEDDAGIRELLSYYFNSTGFIVYTFESGEEYFDNTEDISPSIFILDIMLPNMDGFSILERLRTESQTTETPVILLTARCCEADRIRGLVSGGDDYVTKPFSIKELHARINAVMRRSREIPPPAEFRCLDLLIRPDSHEAFQSGRVLELTNKEFDLLVLLIKNRGKVMSREEILSQVWDYDYLGKTRTVDMHIKSLRAKLGESAKAPQYIVTIHGVGYKINLLQDENHE